MLPNYRNIIFAAALAFAPTTLLADSQLVMDANSLTIQATNSLGQNSAFGGLTHTGGLIFSMDSDSTIGLSIDGTNQVSFTASFYSFSGQISFLNGQSQGGTMTVQVKNTDNSLDTYHFNIAAGNFLSRPIGSSSFRSFGFQLSEDTSAGFFNDANYGGTNITPFFNGQDPLGLNGAFFQLICSPDATGFSNDADVDIVANLAETGNGPVVPLPSSALAGFTLLSLLALSRRPKSI
ncbi:MAG TPA: hypothetical protein VFE58_04980 [Tepidisphaeraceae bacterium]|nr:hypothetical protein [Tepidisphaeraceae bacterium]